MRLAISGEVPAQGYPLETLLPLIRSFGVSALELWPENIPVLEGKTTHPRSYRNRDVKAAQKLLTEHGIEVACATFGGAFDRYFTEDTAFYTEELICCIEVASALGAKFVNSYLYYLSMDDEPDYDYLKALYAPAIAVAERLDITLLLENEAHDSTKNPQVMKEIIQRINSKHFRTNFDAINYYQASYEGFPYAFMLLKDCFSYIHIKDGCIYNPHDPSHNPCCKGGEMTGANVGSTIYYPLMGTGVLNIPAEITALRNMGYQQWCTIEPHVPIDMWESYIREEVKYLKKLGLT